MLSVGLGDEVDEQVRVLPAPGDRLEPREERLRRLVVQRVEQVHAVLGHLVREVGQQAHAGQVAELLHRGLKREGNSA